MKLFVYEHITSGALINQSLPSSLAQEGDAMLSAVLADCHALPQLELSILRDVRLPNISSVINDDTRHQCKQVSTPSKFQQLWLQNLKLCDAVFIIAPETNNVLAMLQQQAIDLGKVILGCQPAAIALTTNKLSCDQRLNHHNITTPTSCLASNWPRQQFVHPDGYVIKPIDGAGCVDTLIFDSVSELEQHLFQQPEAVLQSHIIQAYYHGRAASLSLLMSENDALILTINQQKISREDDKLVFSGCVVNGIDPIIFSTSEALLLAQQIQQAIPDLWGFVGIDLVLTKQQAIVVDINPRLTTSYVGLKQSIATNPMELLLLMKEQGMKFLPLITRRLQVDITL
jgi:tyramine---L-glutamate ligase